MHTSRLASILVLLAVALPVSTAGAQTTGAPGNSGVDQYRESVPSSGGKTKPVDRKTRDALDRQGSDGKALATALERNGGVPAAAAAAGGDSGSGGSSAGGGSGSESKSGSGSGSGAAAGTSTGDSGATTGDEAASDAASEAPVAAASSSALDAKVGPVPVWVLMIVVLASALGAVLVRRGRAA